MDEKSLGERIREYRALRNISLRKFAEMVKLNYLTILNIENNGKHTPTYATIARIEHVLNGGKLPQ